MSGNPIPQSAREAVARRSLGRCERCGKQGPTEIHHRQRRREGGHGLANLIALCPGDHRWAHANPAQARVAGLIIPTWVKREDIHEVFVLTYRGLIKFEEEQ